MVNKWVLIVVAIIVLSTLSQGIRAAPETSTPIQHVIIIMQENHSFDNYFGTYPTANGTLLDETTTQLRHVKGLPVHVCLPYMSSCLSPQLSTDQHPTNPEEGQTTYEMDYSNNGTGFPTFSGPQSMIYFDYHSIPGYWDYAEEFGLADNYYATFMSTTTPNRLSLLAGDTPVSANYGPPPNTAYSQTVLNQLDSERISWGYYDNTGFYGNPSNVYPLNYLSNRPQSAITGTRNISDLMQRLSEGSGLPSVAFVNSLGNSTFDEHPPNNPAIGEMQVVSVVDQVMRSSYWPTTAIFITWDEGGGYYDHVQPPTMFTVDHGFTSPLQGLGQRVPLLVISPFSNRNLVSHTLMSHLSLVHFIEYNWHLPALNERIVESKLPLDFFNFTQSPRDPVILTPPVTYPIPLVSQSAGLTLTPPYAIGIVLVAVGITLFWFSVVRRVRRSSARS